MRSMLRKLIHRAAAAEAWLYAETLGAKIARATVIGSAALVAAAILGLTGGLS